MTLTITASVGRNGINHPSDVKIIQELISWHKQWVHPITVYVNGRYDQNLARAIELFQRKACSILKPDGLVEPNQFTLSRLNIRNIQKPKHSIFKHIYGVNAVKLTDSDFLEVAVMLNCEVEAIKAVAEVETKTGAWDSKGRPTILFERHYFRKLTLGKFNITHKDISGSPGGYGRFSDQYPKLTRAAVLNEKAALQSASWGRFQIMGSNYKQAGFSTISSFVDKMMLSEFEHLQAFASFIKNDKNLLNAIQNKNWVSFAKRYNGPNYSKNKYDLKLKEEYLKFKNVKVSQ